MDFFQAVKIGLNLIFGGDSDSGGPPPGHPEYNKAVRSSIPGGSFLDIIKSGAGAYAASKEGQQATEFQLPQPRGIKELTRGQTAPGGLSSPMQQLFQQAAVMEAMQHYRQNGSRDVNMQSLMNDLGYVRPTTPQGKKTVVTERPELSEIEAR